MGRNFLLLARGDHLLACVLFLKFILDDDAATLWLRDAIIIVFFGMMTMMLGYYNTIVLSSSIIILKSARKRNSNSSRAETGTAAAEILRHIVVYKSSETVLSVDFLQRDSYVSSLIMPHICLRSAHVFLIKG
jgi:hypothetical protein